MDAQAITEALNEPILKDKQPPSGELFEEIADEKSPLFSRKNLSKAGDISQADVAHLIDLFEHGKTFGSLIQIPEKLAEKLPAIAQRVDDVIAHGGMFEQGLARSLVSLISQARLLSRQYLAVAMNPPYMGGRWMNPEVKSFARSFYADAFADLFATFIVRASQLAHSHGRISMITMHSWMFISSFKDLRQRFLTTTTIESLPHLGARAFGSISGEVVQAAAFSAIMSPVMEYRPSFFRLTEGGEEEKKVALSRRNNKYMEVVQDDFFKIPNAPIAYWLTKDAFRAFEANTTLGKWADVKEGLNTGDNDRFLRFWFELTFDDIGFGCASSDEAMQTKKRWFPCNKGGSYRKWFGNNDYVINWQDDGIEIRNFRDDKGKQLSAVRNTRYYFRQGLTWSGVGTAGISVRGFGQGFIFNSGGRSLFPVRHRLFALGFLNTNVCMLFLDVLAPTVNFAVGDISSLPVSCPERSKEVESVESRISP